MTVNNLSSTRQVWSVGRPRLVWIPESCRSSSVLLHTRGALKSKVASSLTDIWQQLFEQQDITVIVLYTIPSTFTPGCMKTTPCSAPAPGDINWNRHAGTCLSETSERRQRTEAASGWNVVSNQQSFTDQAIDQWWYCFNACLKAKSKQWTFAMASCKTGCSLSWMPPPVWFSQRGGQNA